MAAVAHSTRRSEPQNKRDALCCAKLLPVPRSFRARDGARPLSGRAKPKDGGKRPRLVECGANLAQASPGLEFGGVRPESAQVRCTSAPVGRMRSKVSRIWTVAGQHRASTRTKFGGTRLLLVEISPDSASIGLCMPKPARVVQNRPKPRSGGPWELRSEMDAQSSGATSADLREDADEGPEPVRRQRVSSEFEPCEPTPRSESPKPTLAPHLGPLPGDAQTDLVHKLPELTHGASQGRHTPTKPLGSAARHALQRVVCKQLRATQRKPPRRELHCTGRGDALHWRNCLHRHRQWHSHCTQLAPVPVALLVQHSCEAHRALEAHLRPIPSGHAVWQGDAPMAGRRGLQVAVEARVPVHAGDARHHLPEVDRGLECDICEICSRWPSTTPLRQNLTCALHATSPSNLTLSSMTAFPAKWGSTLGSGGRSGGRWGAARNMERTCWASPTQWGKALQRTCKVLVGTRRRTAPPRVAQNMAGIACASP